MRQAEVLPSESRHPGFGEKDVLPHGVVGSRQAAASSGRKIWAPGGTRRSADGPAEVAVQLEGHTVGGRVEKVHEPGGARQYMEGKGRVYSDLHTNGSSCWCHGLGRGEGSTEGARLQLSLLVMPFPTNNKCWRSGGGGGLGVRGEERGTPHTVGAGMEIGAAAVENSTEVL